MTPTPEMQRIAAWWCYARTGELKGTPRCTGPCYSEGRPDCPFLAELLAAMPKEEEAKNEYRVVGEMRVTRCNCDPLGALASRVAALEKHWHRSNRHDCYSSETDLPMMTDGRPS